MGQQEQFQPIAAELLGKLTNNPAMHSFPLVHYPVAFRVPLIITAGLLTWAMLIFGVEGNAARQHARHPHLALHAMTLVQRQ